MRALTADAVAVPWVQAAFSTGAARSDAALPSAARGGASTLAADVPATGNRLAGTLGAESPGA